jgi:nucleoid-associated protein YgaU
VSERDPHRWARFAGSLMTLLALVVVAPIALIAASRSRFGSGNPLAGADPPWRWGSGDVGGTLSGPLANDTVIDGIIRLSLCVVWVAITVIVVTTLVEVAHAVRHHGLAFPDVRGMGWAQQVGRFVAIGLIAVLPMITSGTSLASSMQARAVPAASVSPADRAPATIVTALVESNTPAPTAPTAPTAPSDATGQVHVVARGESVYAIAVGLAGGDSERIREIADAIIDANLGAEMPGGQRFTNPAYIEAGWTLQIPADVAPATPTAIEPSATYPATYTVQDGDTLWEIAEEQLGDPTAWPEIWERNEGDDMGGGRTFDDPNLIVPGWELDLTEPAPVVAEPAPVVIEPAPVVIEPTLDSFDMTSPASGDDSVTNGPLPLTPQPDSTAIASDTTTPSSTTTTIGAVAANPGAGAVDATPTAPAPEAPSPIRLEHAALLAAGILALVGVRRRQRLRAAMPRHRVPEPRPEVARTERRLRTIDAGERVMRIDVACRAAARSLIDTGSQIGWIEVSTDGDLELRLTAPAPLPLPWTGDGQAWRLGAEVPVEILGEDARQVGQPCVALVQLGVTPGGNELLVDLEACGVLAIVALADQADEVVTAIAAALASSQFAEVAHLVGVSLPEATLLNHRNAHFAGSVDASLELAGSLAGSTAMNFRSSFELRSLRTGGEMWEPAVVLLQSADVDGPSACGDERVPAPGHGLAIVVADERSQVGTSATRLVARADGWHLDAFGASIELMPVGVGVDELVEITELIRDAERHLEPADEHELLQWSDDGAPATAVETASPFQPRPHEIVVGLLGGVEVHSRTGEAGTFERSKTVELIAWLTTHRDRATRSAARTALWDLDVRDATFANVVSEARRALARLVLPPEGEEWVARTLTEQLPVHDLVATDADLVEDRLAHARVQPPAQAIETLRPAVELVRDMPFAGTSYLWPDAEGITSNLVLLAITATAEFAGHALSLGDTDGVFWATGKGLRVLPGHEELISLRMQAHARAGDLAGVRHEWESYERVLVADAWSDGEPAPKLLALRRQLLNPTAS